MSTPIERAAIARELRAANARLAGAVVLAGAIAALMVGAGRRLDAARRHAAVALNRAATQLEESDEQLAAANEQLAAVEQLAAEQPTPANALTVGWVGAGPVHPPATVSAPAPDHWNDVPDDQAPDVEPARLPEPACTCGAGNGPKAIGEHADDCARADLA